MFTALKKHCLTIITTFFGLAAVLCFAAASFAWDNFEFSEASLPTYERLRGVPEKELPKAIKKAVLTSSKKSLAVALESYPLDVRYANILGRICASLTPNLSKVYSLPYYVELRALNQLPPYQGGKYTSSTLGQYTPTNERLIIGSFAANKSYNSFASYRVILLDSFMLDTLYRVAQYKAYCGSYDNAYEQALAVYATKVGGASSKRGTVAKFTDISHGLLYRPNANVANPYLPFSLSETYFGNKSGLKWEAISFHSIDRDAVKWANPAHIPLPNGYDSSLYDREAMRNFEKLLAPVLCHEISHCLYGATPPAIVWAQKLLPHADSFATSMMLGFTFGIGYALSVFVGWLGDYIGLQNSLVIWIFSTMILATVVILRVKESSATLQKS